MTTGAAVRIVPLGAIGAPSRLQPLVESIFGGARKPGWFDRKVVRECVDPTLSRVATTGDADDPRHWIGYVLVGNPPSRWPVARTAGTGVRADHRGAGVARALLDAAAAACCDAGACALELWAERSLESFYAGSGFEVTRRITTLVARGRSWGPPRPGPGAWDDAPSPAIEVHAWLREAWEHTPERGVLRLDAPDAALHVTAEHDGWAIHRTQVARLDDAARAFDGARDRLPQGDAVFAVALPEVSSITPRLRALGWLDAQRATIVRRHLLPQPLATSSAMLDNGAARPDDPR
jgi:GNAT superfamily N-acetyltransferase